MEKDTYLVLRVTEAERDDYDTPLSFGTRSTKSAQTAPAVEYQVETHELDPQDYQEVRKDPQVKVMIRPMPLRLIEPVDAPEPSDATAHVHGATWGVYVSGALSSPYVGRNVTVAVLDTGIDAGHEAFQGVELVQKDFTGEGNGDRDGHGTHVAGTIFGQTVQETRYAVAPGVRRALIGKVLGAQRSATTTELVQAIHWAVNQGAHIINMSLGLDFPGLVKWWATERDMEIDLATSRSLAQYRNNLRFFDKLVDLLHARAAHSPSALIIAAAGNESKRRVRPDYTIEVSPPAAADGIVSVAALGSVGVPHDALTVAPFSNIRADVSAPGMGVYSAQKGGGYTYMSGTSMASPHVAGLAALWAERQIQRNGEVNIDTLDVQLRGNTSHVRLPDANNVDVGEGLATAPTN